ncbi:MAG: ATP-binding protein [Flavobacterium sp.]
MKITRFFILFLFGFCFSFSSGQTKAEMYSLEQFKKNKDYLKYIDLSQTLANRLLEEKKHNEYCRLLIETAEVYKLLNDSQRSVKIFFDLLQYIDENDLNLNTSEIYKKLGERYSSLKDTAKAMKYYHKTLKSTNNQSQKQDLKDAYQNLFRLHSAKNPDSAYFFMKKKHQIDLDERSPGGLSSSFNNHFAYYISKGQHELAKKYLDSSYYYAKQYKVDYNITIALGNYAYYHMVYDEDFQKALEYLKYTLDHYKDKIPDQELSFLYQNMGYAYEKLENYERANHFHLEAFYLKDKMYNEDINDAVREVELRYEIDKVEKEFSDKARFLEEQQKRNNRLVILVGSLLVLSLLLLYFFYNYQVLKQKNKLRELDSEIQNNIINASIDGQQLERKKISEVLHDNISALLSSAGLHLSAYMTTTPNDIPEEIIKSRKLLKEAHDNVRDLSHQLIPPVLAKLGLIVALHDLCEKNSNSTLSIDFDNQIGEIIKYHQDFELKIYFIVSELINNILKHSQASKGTVTINEENGIFKLMVSDNGNGLNLKKIGVSDGFGLSQIKSRIKGMKGKIAIESIPNEGTKIEIEVKAVYR